MIRYEDSTGAEIHVMLIIRKAIHEKFQEVKERFLATRYINVALIKTFEDIEKQVEELRTIIKLNDQDRIIANDNRMNKIDSMEVSFDSFLDEPADIWLECHSIDVSVFDSFTYPIFHLANKDMWKIGRENDWMRILSLTFFYRRPKLKIFPCGTYGPCIDAVISGMGFRLKLIPRIKARVQIPFRKFWRKHYYNNQNNWFFELIKNKLESKL